MTSQKKAARWWFIAGALLLATLVLIGVFLGDDIATFVRFRGQQKSLLVAEGDPNAICSYVFGIDNFSVRRSTSAGTTDKDYGYSMQGMTGYSGIE